ncbi:hypothetical protein [Parafrankia colletiae]|nr:hypothetical protein [Parafrankia colletiae]
MPGPEPWLGTGLAAGSAERTEGASVEGLAGAGRGVVAAGGSAEF